MQTKYLLTFAVITILIVAIFSMNAFGVLTAQAQNNNKDSKSNNVVNSNNTSKSSAKATLTSDLPVKPDSQRVDLVKPTFSNPTNITNPLFPISNLHSVVLLGNVDGNLFKSETTLLPGTKTIEVDGKKIETRISQYTAYVNGRLDEVAIDYYAQADDGSVWYLGENVFDYKDGEVISMEGTWLAGKDGPAAMIMPAHPKVGDVFRPENIPGIVFEEVTVKAIGVTVEGPRGPVKGAIITEELHMDGTTEDKIFAPGYGEFSTSRQGLEALAIAVPTNAINKSMPEELGTLSDGAKTIFNAAKSDDWTKASDTLKKMNNAWDSYKKQNNIPRFLEAQTNRALEALKGDAMVPAVNSHDKAGTRNSAVDASLAILDLKLPYLSQSEIDTARFEQWSLQLQVDAENKNFGGVTNDVTTLELLKDRIVHTFDSSVANKINEQLKELRTAANDGDLEKAIDAATKLIQSIPTQNQGTNDGVGSPEDDDNKEGDKHSAIKLKT